VGRTKDLLKRLQGLYGKESAAAQEVAAFLQDAEAPWKASKEAAKSAEKEAAATKDPKVKLGAAKAAKAAAQAAQAAAVEASNDVLKIVGKANKAAELY